jgi:hypothetical protein
MKRNEKEEIIRNILMPDEKMIYEHYDDFSISYIGGHVPWGTKAMINLFLTNQRVIIFMPTFFGGPPARGPFSIFYKDISSVSIITQDKLTATRVILLGILSPLWKKKKPLLVIEMKNDIGEISPICLDFSWTKDQKDGWSGKVKWGLDSWHQNISLQRYNYLQSQASENRPLG